MAIWIKKTGMEIELNDEKATVEYVRSLGWVIKGEEPEGLTLDEMNKDQLEAYAKERFNADLDKRKTADKLREQVKGLEDEHGN